MTRSGSRSALSSTKLVDLGSLRVSAFAWSRARSKAGELADEQAVDSLRNINAVLGLDLADD